MDEQEEITEIKDRFETLSNETMPKLLALKQKGMQTNFQKVNYKRKY